MLDAARTDTDNYYTSYERKSEYSTESCEIIIKAIITKLK